MYCSWSWNMELSPLLLLCSSVDQSRVQGSCYYCCSYSWLPNYLGETQKCLAIFHKVLGLGTGGMWGNLRTGYWCFSMIEAGLWSDTVIIHMVPAGMIEQIFSKSFGYKELEAGAPLWSVMPVFSSVIMNMHKNSGLTMRKLEKHLWAIRCSLLPKVHLLGSPPSFPPLKVQCLWSLLIPAHLLSTEDIYCRPSPRAFSSVQVVEAPLEVVQSTSNFWPKWWSSPTAPLLTLTTLCPDMRFSYAILRHISWTPFE